MRQRDCGQPDLEPGLPPATSGQKLRPGPARTDRVRNSGRLPPARAAASICGALRNPARENGRETVARRCPGTAAVAGAALRRHRRPHGSRRSSGGAEPRYRSARGAPRCRPATAPRTRSFAQLRVTEIFSSPTPGMGERRRVGQVSRADRTTSVATARPSAPPGGRSLPRCAGR